MWYIHVCTHPYEAWVSRISRCPGLRLLLKGGSSGSFDHQDFWTLCQNATAPCYFPGIDESSHRDCGRRICVRSPRSSFMCGMLWSPPGLLFSPCWRRLAALPAAIAHEPCNFLRFHWHIMSLRRQTIPGCLVYLRLDHLYITRLIKCVFPTNLKIGLIWTKCSGKVRGLSTMQYSHPTSICGGRGWHSGAFYPGIASVSTTDGGQSHASRWWLGCWRLHTDRGLCRTSF